MKTTIDIDEGKLLRVMKRAGIRTRKEAVDRALDELDRASRRETVLNRPLYVVPESEPVVDPGYDLRALRERDTAGHDHPD